MAALRPLAYRRGQRSRSPAWRRRRSGDGGRLRVDRPRHLRQVRLAADRSTPDHPGRRGLSAPGRFSAGHERCRARYADQGRGDPINPAQIERTDAEQHPLRDLQDEQIGLYAEASAEPAVCGVQSGPSARSSSGAATSASPGRRAPARRGWHCAGRRHPPTHGGPRGALRPPRTP